jgi:hypothetical protein
MWLAALRRFLGLLLIACAVTVLGALLLGVALGADAWRSISLGFYLVGSFLLVSGFFIGNRGPVRLGRSGEQPLFFGSRFVRWATPEERDENINLSAIFIVLGLVLIVIAVATDTRYELV